MKRLAIVVVILSLVAIGLGICFITGTIGLKGFDAWPDQVSSRQTLSVSELETSEKIDFPASQKFSLTVDKLEREFIVYRPDNLMPNQVVPVVFMYHGGSGTGDKFYKLSGWRQVADKYGLMVVFPTGVKYHVYADAPTEAVPNPPDAYETRWSSYHLGRNFNPDFPDQAPADDVAFTRAMVRFVNQSYAVDTTRIYAAGFSNGGAMVNRLLAEASDIFAAFGSSSSGLQEGDLESALENTPDTYTPRPTAVMIGSTDTKATAAFGVKSLPTDETAMLETSPVRMRYVDGYLSMLGLNDTYTYDQAGKLTTFTFTTEAGRPKAPPVPLKFMIVAGMDHVFPAGKNFPLVAAEVYWEFFQDYRLSE